MVELRENELFFAEIQPAGLNWFILGGRVLSTSGEWLSTSADGCNVGWEVKRMNREALLADRTSVDGVEEEKMSVGILPVEDFQHQIRRFDLERVTNHYGIERLADLIDRKVSFTFKDHVEDPHVSRDRVVKAISIGFRCIALHLVEPVEVHGLTMSALCVSSYGKSKEGSWYMAKSQAQRLERPFGSVEISSTVFHPST